VAQQRVCVCARTSDTLLLSFIENATFAASISTMHGSWSSNARSLGRFTPSRPHALTCSHRIYIPFALTTLCVFCVCCQESCASMCTLARSTTCNAYEIPVTIRRLEGQRLHCGVKREQDNKGTSAASAHLETSLRGCFVSSIPLSVTHCVHKVIRNGRLLPLSDGRGELFLEIGLSWGLRCTLGSRLGLVKVQVVGKTAVRMVSEIGKLSPL